MAAACKLLDAFSKNHEGFVLKGGILKGQILKANDLATLARLPSKEVLLGWLAGMMQAPIRNLAFVAQAPVRSLAVLLEAVKLKKEK